MSYLTTSWWNTWDQTRRTPWSKCIYPNECSQLTKTYFRLSLCHILCFAPSSRSINNKCREKRNMRIANESFNGCYFSYCKFDIADQNYSSSKCHQIRKYKFWWRFASIISSRTHKHQTEISSLEFLARILTNTHY